MFFGNNVSKMAFYQNVQVRLNRDGGIYDNGRRHSQLLRERVLDLHHTGMSQQTIAREVKSSRHFVQNVLRDYDLNNSSMPVRRAAAPRSKTVEDVIEFLENVRQTEKSNLALRFIS
jgi:transposase